MADYKVNHAAERALKPALSTRLVGSEVLTWGWRYLNLESGLRRYIDRLARSHRPSRGPSCSSPVAEGRLKRRDRLGGLLHEYSRAA